MRLFVAVAVPDEARKAVAAAAAPLRSLGTDLRWIDPHNWHLTVAFLGETDAGLVEPLLDALSEVAGGFAPFDVQLRTAAGRNARSGVLWVELEPCEPLAAVAAAVKMALRGLGLRTEDRAFRPHLTLARARARGSVPRGLATAYHGPTIAWTVPGLELVRSHLRRSGACYETLAQLRFLA